MGLSKDTHIGPYLVVDFKKTVQEEEIRYCKTHPKLKQGSAKFCSECGGEIIVEVLKKEEKDGIFDILEGTEFEDDFMDSKYLADEICIPNKSCYYLGDEVEEIDCQTIEKELSEFLVENRECLEFIKTKVNSVAVKYGCFYIYG